MPMITGAPDIMGEERILKQDLFTEQALGHVGLEPGTILMVGYDPVGQEVLDKGGPLVPIFEAKVLSGSHAGWTVCVAQEELV